MPFARNQVYLWPQRAVWYIKGFDPERVEEMKAYCKECYQQDVR